jgi:hypothetical protein
LISASTVAKDSAAWDPVATLGLQPDRKLCTNEASSLWYPPKEDTFPPAPWARPALGDENGQACFFPSPKTTLKDGFKRLSNSIVPPVKTAWNAI